MNKGVEFTMTFAAALLVIMWFCGSMKQIRKDVRERQSNNNR